MIETDIDYPKGLPWPEREEYTAQAVSPFVRTSMASGRARQRRRFTSVPVEYTVTWIFNGDNRAALFEAWFRDALNDGVEWFNMPMKTPTGTGYYVCRFIEMYSGPNPIGICSWRVSAKLEMFERPLMPQGWGLLPEFVLGASIFDIAMNREWPEHVTEYDGLTLLTEAGKLLIMEDNSTPNSNPQAVKISELPEANPLTGEEYIPVVQSGVTKRSKAADVSKADDTNYAFYYEISKS